MVREWVPDFFEDPFVWRCVNCGAIVDPTVQRDRLAEPVGSVAGQLSQELPLKR
jgi:hypothetical protein